MNALAERARKVNSSPASASAKRSGRVVARNETTAPDEEEKSHQLCS